MLTARLEQTGLQGFCNAKSSAEYHPLSDDERRNQQGRVLVGEGLLQCVYSPVPVEESEVVDVVFGDKATHQCMKRSADSVDDRC